MTGMAPRARSTAMAVLSTVAIAVVCQRVLHVNATVAAIVLMLGVLVAGAYTKLPEAVLVSVTATLCLDYFFVPPIGSITIGAPQGWIVLAVFLAGSLLASHLAARLREQRDELFARQRESEKLHALSRAMLLSSGEDIRRLIVNKCIELFGFSEVVLYETAAGRFYRSSSQGLVSDDKLRKVALYGSVEHDEAARITVLPVILGNKNFGSLGFREIALPAAALQALGNTIAVGLVQAQVQEAGSRAEAVRKSEELKSVMLDALAHELKTPLTAISAAADMLIDQPGMGNSQRHELLSIIQQETGGLNRLVGEAMHLARIDAKRLKLESEPVSVSDIVDAAVKSLGERAASHHVKVQTGEELPLVFADRELMVQALKQLIDNAIKYSPSRSTITVTASESGGLVSISVRDQGQGLTELEQGRVFEKFYRGRYDHSAVQGTGMGLAIAKEISEAHGGSLKVESQLGQGSRFTITLHAAAERSTVEEQHA
jgi:two-component system, OmpR family, sensor histidine kinase KdpD